MKTIIILIMGLFVSFAAIAAEGAKFEKRDSCVTKATGWDGKRSSCRKTISFPAPKGHEILEHTVELVQHDGRGSEYSCGEVRFEYEDRGSRIAVRTWTVIHARSSKGSHSGRGRIECSLRGQYE